MSCRMIYPKRLRSKSIQLPSISCEGWFKVTTDYFFWLIVIYREDTILSLMGRLFGWGGSTSVSTTGTLETT